MSALHARLGRLERQHHNADAASLTPQIWRWLCGDIPLEQLDHKTRTYIESL